MQYYIISNGSQLGPYSKEELSLQGLTPDSIVWRSGLSEWVKASTLPELSDIISESAFSLHTETPETMKSPYPDFAAGQQPQQPPQPQQPVQNPYGQPYPPAAPYGMPQQPYNYRQPFPVPHTNWMPWAIIVTIISGCTTCVGLILGIISIVYASKANAFYANGQQAEGDAANSTARTLTIVNIVLLVLGVIFSVAYFSVFSTSLLSYL
ncbi:MAG: GYF domain-containing protein [Muribaculaceae bacterium]|nr:GYF domain-containing protein [Muribaculaceae bacterium]